jgi:hypothetical protein
VFGRLALSSPPTLEAKPACAVSRTSRDVSTKRELSGQMGATAHVFRRAHWPLRTAALLDDALAVGRREMIKEVFNKRLSHPPRPGSPMAPKIGSVWGKFLLLRNMCSWRRPAARICCDSQHAVVDSRVRRRARPAAADDLCRFLSLGAAVARRRGRWPVERIEKAARSFE